MKTKDEVLLKLTFYISMKIGFDTGSKILIQLPEELW